MQDKIFYHLDGVKKAVDQYFTKDGPKITFVDTIDGEERDNVEYTFLSVNTWDRNELAEFAKGKLNKFLNSEKLNTNAGIKPFRTPKNFYEAEIKKVKELQNHFAQDEEIYRPKLQNWIDFLDAFFGCSQYKLPLSENNVSGEEREINETDNNKEFTTARQVLAIHYLLQYTQVKNIDLTEKARFVQFLTGRETGAKTIKNTNIYKRMKSPLSADERTLTQDLQFVRQYFEKLGLTEICKAITNEISSREKI